MTTRRTFLRLATLGLTPSLVGCGDNLSAGGSSDSDPGEDLPPATNLVAGVGASFEVDHRGALLWLHSEIEAPVSLELFRDALDRIPLSEPTAGIRIVELTGLAPATRYWFRAAFVGTGETAWHQLTTAPDPASIAPVRFCYSADIGDDYSLDLIEVVRATEPDFYLNLGDWPYQDRAPAARSLDEFLAKHRAARDPAAIRELLRDVPIYAIYDDHDIVDNWDARDRVEQPERVAAGLQAWDLNFPMRGPTRYRRIRRGALAEIFVLDTRLYRSANDDPDGPDKTMLGAEQRAWLEEGLATSDAAFKIIASSVPFGLARGNDHWSSFRHERDAILSFIADNDITGVLVISADRHYFEAHHYASGLKEFHVGPLAAGPGRPAALTDEIVARFNERNVGEISIEPGDPPLLTFRCLDGAGAVVYEESFAPGALAIEEL